MKEKPVLFNAEMVRAVLDGRKTQTRRIMRVQPSADFHPMNMALETDFTARWYTPGVVDKDGYLQPGKHQVFGVAGEDEGYICPFGAVGDRLWVREAFAAFDADWIYPGRPQDLKDGPWPNVVFPADGVLLPPGTCRPSIHMPRWASRITLEITGVRVERLQDISEGDAKAEGLAEITKDGSLFKFGIPDRDGYPGTDDNGWPWTEWERNPVDAYRKIWQSIYGDDSWQANPFVWCIEFNRVEE